jgi:hypothetical protein
MKEKQRLHVRHKLSTNWETMSRAYLHSWIPGLDLHAIQAIQICASANTFRISTRGTLANHHNAPGEAKSNAVSGLSIIGTGSGFLPSSTTFTTPTNIVSGEAVNARETNCSQDLFFRLF